MHRTAPLQAERRRSGRVSSSLRRSPSTSRSCPGPPGRAAVRGPGRGCRPNPTSHFLGTQGPERRPDCTIGGVLSRIPAARPIRNDRDLPAVRERRPERGQQPALGPVPGRARAGKDPR
ncbi:uncharacterized protein LOC119471776 [Cebus imitator]|uniref:uncharacterized protein LOC119471776 n=1 Tax=Cebus imitator TaxID=2715852 RepID=UPI00189AEB15|nr:uncharacterized protein LOC119471776 [Cebus imitator]